ncbi:helix-turn-helix transcriptional regulator [Aureimonas sp. ME7]|uniref:AraC family transcriptional regulator n=1 Tax=Aureimonas sp. ME7 TaxID=2744252 RepID=UPI0015F49266|nr:helix-turn-helix transcriptional regulator [Aureimonas sp. ME7]
MSEEDLPRTVIGVSSDHTSTFELAEHSHRRGQLLYAAKGVVTVSTPQGAWVAPPERGVWIPGGVPHSIKTAGAVQFRCVLIEPAAITAFGPACRVIRVSLLLRQLLVESADIPARYDERGRDGLVMRLLVAEVNAAQTIPIAVPFPRNGALATRCRAFLKHPDISETIDMWAEAMSMDRRRFTRLFRRETGMSFMEWKRQACLSWALPRLAEGDPITTIALDLGYGNTAGFSAMFRRALGSAPSTHRTELA